MLSNAGIDYGPGFAPGATTTDLTLYEGGVPLATAKIVGQDLTPYGDIIEFYYLQ
jgi:hypothetical protein